MIAIYGRMTELFIHPGIEQRDLDECLRAWEDWHDGGSDRGLIQAAKDWLPALVELAGRQLEEFALTRVPPSVQEEPLGHQEEEPAGGAVVEEEPLGHLEPPTPPKARHQD
jgi:hypothetical protein